MSIIVACVRPYATLARWLQAIEPQLRGRRVELLVAVAGHDHTVEALLDRHAFELISGDGGALVPALWGLAMTRARGAVWVVTVSTCVPCPDWLDAIDAAHEAGHAGVGGGIDIARDASLIDRAVHLVRYTRYLPPLAPGFVSDIAGDNGAYKRTALVELIPVIAREGFWEFEVHRTLERRGDRLWLDPRIRVMLSGPHAIAAFSRQRFLHGRTFGRTRAAARSRRARFARALGVPLVAPLMLVRALAALAAKGRLDARALAAAPLAAWFFACWAAGEGAGHFS